VGYKQHAGLEEGATVTIVRVLVSCAVAGALAVAPVTGAARALVSGAGYLFCLIPMAAVATPLGTCSDQTPALPGTEVPVSPQ